MHIASDDLVGRMALADAAIFPAPVDDGKKLALIVRTSTETLKWISKRVAVELVIGHVCMDEHWIRCMGLRVADSDDQPQLINELQFEEKEIALFDHWLAQHEWPVSFHNENPFVSVLDAVVTLDRELVQEYAIRRKSLTFLTARIPTQAFRKAQELFERAIRKPVKPPLDQVTLVRFPLTLAGMTWNGIGMPETGTFEPWDADEGGSHEVLLFQVIKPHFKGTVIKGPKISDGNGSRELCDLLALSDAFAWVFEAKAFSVFEKNSSQTPERRAKTILGHFEKGIRQLQGALRSLDNGVCLLEEHQGLGTIRADDFEAIHCLVIVSTVSWKLPWEEIAETLRRLQQPRVFFHLMPMMELQRLVAFTLGEPKQLHLALERRAQIVSSSGNAKIQTMLIPEPPQELRMPPVSSESRAVEFAIERNAVNDPVVLTNLLRVFDALLGRLKFSGRWEIRHEVYQYEGRQVYCLGVAAEMTGSVKSGPDDAWWRSFMNEFCSELRTHSSPTPISGTVHCLSVAKHRERFPDLLVIMECSKGQVLARRMGSDN